MLSILCEAISNLLYVVLSNVLKIIMKKTWQKIKLSYTSYTYMYCIIFPYNILHDFMCIVLYSCKVFPLHLADRNI